jgi:hypothetical protein
MQLQTLLCYSYAYNMIFITIFKMKHKFRTALGSALHKWEILGVHLLSNLVSSHRLLQLHNTQHIYVKFHITKTAFIYSSIAL